MATAEFSKFAGILSAALSQHRLSGFEMGALMIKNLPANAGDARDTVSVPGSEDLLELEMAAHSSILAWKIPRSEEPGGLLSMGSQRIGHV